MPAVAHDAFRLAGKVALVTGSTMGIGEATVHVLAQAGAHVVVSSRKQADCERVAGSLRRAGLSAEGRACHIGRMDDIAAMAEHLAASRGGLDVLVNNAVLSPLRRIEDTDLGLFTKTVEVDLRADWFLSAEAVRVMQPDVPYAVTKHAAIAQAEWLAIVHGADGIGVSCLWPGAVDTPIPRAEPAERLGVGRPPACGRRFRRGTGRGSQLTQDRVRPDA